MNRRESEDFIALPEAGTGPGVLVLHAWWGLNDTVKAFCVRLAEAGFVAYAPDLYRGTAVTRIEDAERLSAALDTKRARADVAAAVDRLADRVTPDVSGLAVVGFSLGAFFALDLSVADPERIRKVVVFYGTGPGDYGRSRAEYLGHFAAVDPFEPPENVEWLANALQAAGRPATFYEYPGTGHWFFEADRADAYNVEAAALAWTRTRAFLESAPATMID